MKSVGIAALAIAALLTGCASGSVIRASTDTIIVQASAAPACGLQGAGQYATKVAALETIRAGYDKYIISVGTAQQNYWSGTNDQNLTAKMFKYGSPGANQAIDARQTLGPDWQTKVKNGINTCT